MERLEEIPVVDSDEREYTSVVIVPMDELHDSGYRCMCFLFCDGDEIVCRSHGGSDVLHIDGIGGLGNWYGGKIPDKVDPKGWCLDCLPNGYLRLFSYRKIKPDIMDGSSYEVFGKSKIGI